MLDLILSASTPRDTFPTGDQVSFDLLDVLRVWATASSRNKSQTVGTFPGRVNSRSLPRPLSRIIIYYESASAHGFATDQVTFDLLGGRRQRPQMWEQTSDAENVPRVV